MTDEQLEAFIRESWKIEGYDEPVGLLTLMSVHWEFIDSAIPTRAALAEAALIFTGNVGVIRDREGLDVQVGYHVPPPGGPEILDKLDILLEAADDLGPYQTHVAYEDLHPFMDGNGRTGRMLWAWHMEDTGEDPYWVDLDRGFLHTFYYQSLGAKR